MHDNASGPRKRGSTTEEPLHNHRVTARIVRDGAGNRRRVYEALGREFESREALKAALGVSA